VTDYRVELEQIKKDNGGLLQPSKVVDYASDPDTALHSRFTWDDTEAAKQHRLWQARQIIRVEVTILPNTNEPIRAFVSLPGDRMNPEGGYRSIDAVMKSQTMRESLLEQAQVDMERFSGKYTQVKEVARVIAAMKKVPKKAKK